MPEVWIKEAEDLKASGTSGTMSGKGGPRATLHCTVSGTGQFADMHRVLTGKRAEPHLLYSFADDRLGQYFPLNASARALMGNTATPSGVSHNKVGTVNIQIEVVGSTDDWTARADWRPGPNFRAMMRAIASWGIKPEFIYRPAQTSSDRGNVVRSFATMTGTAGGGKWWGHCHYPDGESHWDPGRVNVQRFFAAAGIVTPPPVVVPPPTAPTTPPVVKHTRLSVDGDFGPATIRATQQWLKTAYRSGVTVDGDWGPASRMYLELALNYEAKKHGWAQIPVGKSTKPGMNSTHTARLRWLVGVTPTAGPWDTRTTKALQTYLNTKGA